MQKIYEYIGLQEGIGNIPAVELFNLLISIPGHPKGSTVSKQTLIEEGVWEE